MEEKDNIIVKWTQEDVGTSNNLLNCNNKVYLMLQYERTLRAQWIL